MHREKEKSKGCSGKVEVIIARVLFLQLQLKGGEEEEEEEEEEEQEEEEEEEEGGGGHLDDAIGGGEQSRQHFWSKLTLLC